MTTKHTKGPWRVAGANVKSESDIGIHGKDYIICDMCRDGYDDSEQMANAALIAAAPELLVAVQRCLNYIEGAEAESGQTLQCGDLARAAIQKATSIGGQ